MEESQHLMWMKRKQVLKAHLQAPLFGDGNSYSSWEERAFAEDAARILGGSTWPPRSYSCTFCKREFRSAQALGGHMNVHRRDRARLKQNLSPHNEALDHHHKNDQYCKSLLGIDQFSSEISPQLDCCLNIPYSSTVATMITTGKHSSSRLSSLSTGENGGQHALTPYSSSIIWGQKMGSPNSEPQEVINAREDNFKDLGCNDSVETGLSVGLSSMFGQKSPTVPCGDEAIIGCKKLKATISSLPVCLKPCSKDRHMAFQSAEVVLGLNPGMEDLDLELRLGKPQKV